MNAKISIVIPTYNRSYYLERTIKSIQAQDFDNYEILVVDDGSTDDTKEKMLPLCAINKNVRYFYQPNSGRSAARNLGIKNAVGEWILFLDSDDLMAEGALSFLASKIPDYPQAGMIAGTYLEMDEDEKLLDQTPARKKQKATDGLVENSYLNIIRNFYLPMGSYIVRRDVVMAGSNFRSDLEPCEDYDFCLQMARGSYLAYFNKPIVKIRKHVGNTPLDIFYKTSIKVAHKNLTEVMGDDSIKNKKLIISEWKTFIADEFFNQKKYKNAFLSYISAAYYNPKLALNKRFCKQVFSCLVPKSVNHLLKSSLRSSFGRDEN